MRQVKDKVAFFERHLNNGDDDSQGRRRSGSLAESTESFHSGDETPSPEKIEKPGKRIYFSENEDKTMPGLASKASSDIWSLFPGQKGGPPVTRPAQGGRHGAAANPTWPANNRYQQANANASIGFYSRHSQDIKSQSKGERKSVGMSSSNTIPPLSNPFEGRHPVQAPSSPAPIRKVDPAGSEHVGRAMGASNGGQKRTWGVANGNRGYTLQSSVESIPAAADDEGSSPRYKRLNREQTSLLNAVVDRSHDSEFSVDDSSLPRPTPPKGSSEAKLQYAKRMQAGYLRSTGRGPFIPKPPSKWGGDNG